MSRSPVPSPEAPTDLATDLAPTDARRSELEVEERLASLWRGHRCDQDHDRSGRAERDRAKPSGWQTQPWPRAVTTHEPRGQERDRGADHEQRPPDRVR